MESNASASTFARQISRPLADSPADTSVFARQVAFPVTDTLPADSTRTREASVVRTYKQKGRSYTVNLIAQRLELPEWFNSVVNDLGQIATLPENWDSYGALPVSGEAITSSLVVLSHLISYALPRPQVGPTVRGGVEFEWHKDGVDLEIQTEISGIHFYFRIEGHPEGEREEEFEDITVDRLAEVLREIIPSAIGTLRSSILEHGRPQER